MLEDPQIMTTPMSITSFLHCSCRMLEPMAFDQAIRWQPENRQSGRGLLSEPENLVTYRDRRTRGSQCCRLFGKSWAGDPTNTILQEPPQPTSMAQPQGDIPASQGTAQKNSCLLCLHTTEFTHSCSKSRHHELLSPCYTWGNWGNGSTSDQKNFYCFYWQHS